MNINNLLMNLHQYYHISTLIIVLSSTIPYRDLLFSQNNIPNQICFNLLRMTVSGET